MRNCPHCGGSLARRQPSAPAKNRRQGPASKAFPGLRLPRYTRQACGHVFNSAGCAICPQCTQERWASKPAGYFAPTMAHTLETLREAA